VGGGGPINKVFKARGGKKFLRGKRPSGGNRPNSKIDRRSSRKRGWNGIGEVACEKDKRVPGRKEKQTAPGNCTNKSRGNWSR